MLKACGRFSLSLIFFSIAASASASVVNGSFETGDYTGWTLVDELVDTSLPFSVPAASTWGIATDGQVINSGDFTFDFADNLLVQQTSPHLPNSYSATDGDFVAYQLQAVGAGQRYRMYQDLTLSDGDRYLLWDMSYVNHFDISFPGQQDLSVNIRDPLTDIILDVLYVSADAPTVNPVNIPTMTFFSADIEAFAGLDIRLDVLINAEGDYFDAAFDNIRIVTPVPAAVWLFVTALVGLAGFSKRNKTA